MAEAKQSTGAKPSKRILEKKQKKKGGSDEPTKEEYAVAKHVRFHCPTKTTTFGHHGGEDVSYFVGSKAVDCLMESKWSASSKKASKKQQPLFVDRQSCVDYMQQLLMKGLFFRAKKLVPKIKEKAEPGEKKKEQTKSAGVKDDAAKSPKAGKDVKRRKNEKEQKDEEDEKAGKEKEKDGADNDDDKEKEKSKARKIRLDFHAEQLFIDGPSIYVWKYDPTPLKTFLLGLGIVFGAIALCLFPLWPLQIRTGVYYLSLAAMGFLGVFVGLIVLRVVLFAIVWTVTLTRHHFWLLPNLTEDCGVLESFKPLYSHKYSAPGTKSADDEKKKRKKKENKSDSDEDADAGKKSDSEDENGADEKGEDVLAENRDTENGSEDNQEIDGGTGSQDDDDDNKSDVSTNSQSLHSSDEETPAPDTKSPKRRRPARRDEGHDSNNGDYEFVEKPN